METFKTGLQQANSLINNNTPFDVNRISRDPKKTPKQLFDNYRMVQMSPNDYYKFVGHVTGYGPKFLMEQRQETPGELSVDEIQKMMREGTKFDTTWLRLDDSGEPGWTRPYWQEGLHRMLAAGKEYGMDTKFPVYIGYEDDPWNELDTMSMDDFIKHYDDTRLKRYNEQKEREAKEQAQRDDYWRNETADFFKVPYEKVTQDQIDKYMKYLDELFKEEWK